MEAKQYCRRVKEKCPVIAMCYDFDKTLSPDDMQAQGYIQSLGFDVSDFWRKSNSLAEQNDMDQNLAYMLTMKEEAEGKVLFTKETLMEYGSKVQLYPGVDDWFERIKEYGEQRNVKIEHYIISSGLKEMIEGTKVARDGAFEKIYASSFYYNDRNVALWPAQVVNYTNKTQFLFRIEKGVLDVNDPAVNEYFPSDKIRIPFRNMVYIGDSDTDIPCMKLVNLHGGYSIGVYDSEKKDKSKVYKMIRDNRIKYFAAADYRENSELDILIKEIIDRTAYNEKLEERCLNYIKELCDFDKSNSEEERVRTELILALENSRSFANTHMVINKLDKVAEWSDDNIDRLCEIGLNNQQVFYILCDKDIKKFYSKIVGNTSFISANIIKMKEKLEK